MSNNDRQVAEVTTASNHKVKYNTYITAVEKREITDIYLSAADKEAKNLPRATFRAEDKSFQLVVVSLDDNDQDVLNRILALPSNEYDEITEIVKGVIETKKK